ncbi:MAG: hypothetical protein IJO96_08680 [Oscillospiraceae bacterium]|nr:hypothetical protein [Oscillospiraceae bacterium]
MSDNETVLNNEEEVVEISSEEYINEMKWSLRSNIFKLVLFLIVSAATIFVSVSFFDKPDLGGFPVAFLLIFYTVLPFISFGKGYTKTTEHYEYGNLVNTTSRSMAFEGLIASVVLGLAYFIFYLICRDNTKCIFLIKMFNSVMTVFIFAYPIGKSILDIVVAKKIINSAKKQQAPVNDTVTEELADKLFSRSSIIKVAAVVVFVAALILSVVLGIGVGKKAAVYEEAFDYDKCIKLVDGIDPKLITGTWHEFSADFTRCTYECSAVEKQAGHPVPMTYIVDFKYDKKTDSWTFDKLEKEYSFLLSSDPTFRQAGFWEGSGKLVKDSSKATIDLVFTNYDDQTATGEITLRYKDGTTQKTSFKATCEMQTDVFLHFFYKDTYTYTATLASPFSTDKTITFVYTNTKDSIDVTYMDKTITLDRYIPE